MAEVACTYPQKTGTKKPSGNIELQIKNASAQDQVVIITDNSYKAKPITQTITAGNTAIIPFDLSKSNNWYDVSITIKDRSGFERRYAGHVETGEASTTDPLMGGVVT
jgi:phospholipase C